MRELVLKNEKRAEITGERGRYWILENRIAIRKSSDEILGVEEVEELPFPEIKSDDDGIEKEDFLNAPEETSFDKMFDEAVGEIEKADKEHHKNSNGGKKNKKKGGK